MIAGPRPDHPGASSKRSRRALHRGQANGTVRDDRDLGGDVAHLHRLIVLALLCFAGASAFALIPPKTSWRASAATVESFGDTRELAVSAWQALMAAKPAWTCASSGEAWGTLGVSAAVVDSQSFTYTLTRPATSGSPSGACGGAPTTTFTDTGALVAAGGICPANSVAVSGGCQCTSPYVENAAHTACEPPPDPCKALAGLSAGDWWKDVGVNAAGTGPKSRTWSTCDGYNTVGGGKCIATVANSECTNSDTDGVSGFWRCTGKAVYTGASAVAGKCDLGSAGAGDGSTPESPTPATPPVPGTDPPKSPDKPVPGTSAPAPCPPGQAPGTVNGTTSCYPTGSDVPKAGGADRSTTDSDGTKHTEHDETTCNAGGSKCSTDTTKCTTPAGSTTQTCTTTNSTDTATGLCSKSPGNSVCSGGSGGPGGGFSGNCTAGFIAKGDDPIMNAMALEQYKRNCQFFEKKPDATDETRAYDDMVAKGKQGGDQTGDLPAGSKREISIGPNDFDYSSAIGVQQCFTDRSVQIMGHTLVVPLSIVCPWLEMLGNILVVVGSLLAARIVVRG